MSGPGARRRAWAAGAAIALALAAYALAAIDTGRAESAVVDEPLYVRSWLR